jgi:hypothetical protein
LEVLEGIALCGALCVAICVALSGALCDALCGNYSLLPPFDFPLLGFELSFDELELLELPEELEELDESDEPPLEDVLLSADADFLYDSLR